MKDRSARTATLIWAAVMIAVISSTATMLLVSKPASTNTQWVSEEQYALIERYGRLDEVRQKLIDQYYLPVESDDLVLGAIQGMTAAVNDVYTFYYTPEQLIQEQNNNEGRYFGVGVLIDQNAQGYIEVLKVYPNTPADDAGLQAGDVVIAVDGVPVGVDGKPYSDAVAMIRGEDETKVTMTVLRGDKTMKITVTRANVTVDYAEYTMLENGVGYISISQFTGNAADRFDEAIGYFEENGARGMIIDVRNNPGGLLTVVNRIADRILPEGVIVYIQDREGKRIDYYSDKEMCDLPLVVLTNKSSASASEILAASVQALERGKVVGTTTFGKGIVQTLITFEEDGAGMQLTTSSYYDASGRSIHGVGVTPDVWSDSDEAPLPATPDPETDSQLKKAIETLEGLMQ